MKMTKMSCPTLPSILFLFLGLILGALGHESSSNSSFNSNSSSNFISSPSSNSSSNFISGPSSNSSSNFSSNSSSSPSSNSSPSSSPNCSSSLSLTSDFVLREEFERLKDLIEDLREQVQRQMDENEELTSALISPAQWTNQALRGPPGPTGQKGENGIIGLSGEKGDTGVAGREGPRGTPGQKGHVGLPGVKGDKGDRGLTGSTGEKGENGISGVPGARGEQGISGQKGEKGTITYHVPEFPSNCSTQVRLRASSPSLSTSYPTSGQYGANLEVCYMVTPPPGGVVLLTVTKVQTEANYDYLQIYKSTNGVFIHIDKLTGDLGYSLQKKYSSNTDEPFLLHFHSDGSGSSNGVSFSIFAG